ncbi:MAG: hypothetical protein EBT92_10835 [Planctomycetes bacterium]|nr:hypothetical protein [Planctomycetota bacterium]
MRLKPGRAERRALFPEGRGLGVGGKKEKVEVKKTPMECNPGLCEGGALNRNAIHRLFETT